MVPWQTAFSASYRVAGAGWGTTSRWSRLGPPLVVVAVTRMVLVPAVRVTVVVALAQVSQEPVGGKSRVPVAVPLTVLQKPVPEKPGWSESMVPWQTPFSASYRVAPGPTGGSGAWVQFSSPW